MRYFLLFALVLATTLLFSQTNNDPTWTRVQDLHQKVKAMETAIAPLREAGKDKALLMKMERKLEDEYNALREALLAYRANTFSGKNDLIKERVARDGDGEGIRRRINDEYLGKERPQDLTGYLVKDEHNYVYLLPNPMRIKTTPVADSIYKDKIHFTCQFMTTDDKQVYGGRITLYQGDADDETDYEIIEHRTATPINSPSFTPSVSFPLSPEVKALYQAANRNSLENLMGRNRLRAARRAARGEQLSPTEQEQIKEAQRQRKIEQGKAEAALNNALKNMRLLAEIEAIAYYQKIWEPRLARIDGYLLLDKGAGIYTSDVYLMFKNWALRNNLK